jgi:SAM-dependent methyltransferase
VQAPGIILAVHRDDFDAALQPGFRRDTAAAYRALAAVQAREDEARLGQGGASQATPMRRRGCPLCADDGDQPALYLKAGMEVVRCRRCPMVYSRTVLDESADRAFYGATEFQAEYLRLRQNASYAALEARKCRYLIEQLARHVAAPGRLLEIGSGAGGLLEAARQSGWTVLGIEPNPALAAECERRGLPVLHGWFPQALGAERGFEAIALLDVLEHALEPVALLRAAGGRLAPGGVLAIQVPNFDSLILRLQGERSPVICHSHWNYFNCDTLERCAVLAGLRALQAETIISELDRVLEFPAAEIAARAREIGAKASLPERLDADWLHAQRMGHKVLAFFAAA